MQTPTTHMTDLEERLAGADGAGLRMALMVAAFES